MHSVERWDTEAEEMLRSFWRQVEERNREGAEVSSDCPTCRFRYTASMPLPEELQAFTSELQPISLTDKDMARLVADVVEELRRTTFFSMPEVCSALIHASGGSPPTFYDAVCKALARQRLAFSAP